MRCVLSAVELLATGQVQSRTGHSLRCRCPLLNVRRVVEHHHDAVFPPLTAMIWPVMNEALAEATKTMASAISSGLPARFSGTPATKRSSIAVSIGPGAIALTRTPNVAPSSAADLVNPSTACLLAV